MRTERTKQENSLCQISEDWHDLPAITDGKHSNITCVVTISEHDEAVGNSSILVISMVIVAKSICVFVNSTANAMS